VEKAREKWNSPNAPEALTGRQIMAQKEILVEVPGSHRELAPRSRAVGRPAPSDLLEVSILIRSSSRPPELPEIAFTPLSHEEFSHRYGAAQADIDRITRFAIAQGLQVVEVNVAGRIVRVAGPLHKVCKTFGVDLRLYEADGKRYRGRVGPVLVPQSVASIIEGVFGLDNRPAALTHSRFLAAKKSAITPHGVTIPGPSFTPPQVATLYNFPQGDGTGEVIGIIELGGGFLQSDLNAYFTSLGITTPSVIVFPVNGSKNAPNSTNNNSKTDLRGIEWVDVRG
jgi:kumamolisin